MCGCQERWGRANCLLVCKSLVYQEPTSDLMQITVCHIGFMKVGLDAVTEWNLDLFP